MSEPTWSRELESWAQRAGYSSTYGDGAATMYSEGGENRYAARARDDSRYELTFASRGGDERVRLIAVSMDLLERHLFGVLGDVIREALRLPFLMMPWEPDQVAPGYSVGEMSDDGYRYLSKDGAGPVASARDPSRSLITLIPLSHFLVLTIGQLEDSYLSQSGSPLLSVNGYAN